MGIDNAYRVWISSMQARRTSPLSILSQRRPPATGRLSRMVMVVTDRSPWNLSTDVGGIAEGVDSLLVVASAGRAWIATEGEFVEGERARKIARERVGEFARLAGDGRWSTAELVRRPESHRIRLLVDSERLTTVLGIPAETARRFYVGVIEFTLAGHLDRLFCHITLALFTHRPHQPEFRPPVELADRKSPLPAVEVREAIQSLIEPIGSAFRTWMANCGFSPVRFLVFGRSSRAPIFVVAVPEDQDSPPSTLGRPIGRQVLQAGPGDQGVGTSTFGDGLYVIRRIVPVDDPGDQEDHVRYLIIPSVPEAGGPPDRRNAVQEAATADLLRLLTRVETFAATALNEVDRRFEMLSAALEVYESVGAQAADLWDALALHLSRRGRTLRRTHRSVEMLHHTLLQGIADLAQTQTEIREELERIDVVAGQLTDMLARSTTERAMQDQSVGSSVVGGGYFDRMRVLGRQQQAKGVNVRQTYQSLLDAMARAFDERRARESDVVEKSALPIGIAVGLLGLVTVAQTTFSVAWVGIAAGWVLLIRVVCWALGLVTVLALPWILLSVRRVSRLGSRRFDNRYGKVVDYLRRSSTVALNEFTSAAGTRDRKWKKLDHTLSAQFAALWDDAFTEKAPSRRRMLRTWTDLDELQSRTEGFCLRALMVAERPRDFTRYRLPLLTTLYRTRSSRLFVTPAGTPVSLVSDVEFSTVLKNTRHIEGDGLVQLEHKAQKSTARKSRKAIKKFLKSISRPDARDTERN